MILAIEIAKLHPLLVHLPIGILIIAFMMECFDKYRKNEVLAEAINFSLLVGFIAGVCTCITGWLLAEGPDYSDEATFNHRWLAIAMTCLTGILYLLKIKLKGKKLVFPLFILTVILLSITGHYGGVLTHGEDYIFSKDQASTDAISDIQNEMVYATIIEPIIADKCVACHNDKKAKGELNMMRYASLLNGGKNGNIFDFDSIPLSELLVRVHLEDTDKKHMPPKGKKQLTKQEIKLLSWWISNKACEKCVPSGMENTASVSGILKKIEEENNKKAILVDDYDLETVQNLLAMNISVTPIELGSQLLEIDMNGMNIIPEDVIDNLEEISQNITSFNGSKSDVNEALVSVVSEMKNLRWLQLQNSNIDDKKLAQLTTLESLEILNIYGTSVSDTSINKLIDLPSLKKIYVWNSEITENGISKLTSSNPGLIVQGDAGFKVDEVSLATPQIISEDGIFQDSMKIELSSSFKSASFYYTLDGTDPTVNGIKYEEPIVIYESSVLKTFAKKEGWKNSETLAQNFIRSGKEILMAKFNCTPSPKYTANGANSLIDLKIGEEKDLLNNWIGIQRKNLVATLQLTEPSEIRKVVISALHRPNDWIFSPIGIKMLISENGMHYKEVAVQNIAQPEAAMTAKTGYHHVNFEPLIANYVKIEIRNMGTNPSWHPFPGEPSWVFVDEVIIE